MSGGDPRPHLALRGFSYVLAGVFVVGLLVTFAHAVSLLVGA